MTKIFSFLLSYIRQPKSVYARRSSNILCLKTAKAFRGITGGNTNKAITYMLVILMLTTFCGTLTPLPQSASTVESETKVQQSQNSAVQQRPVEACSPNAETSFSEDKFFTTDWNASLLPKSASISGNMATYVSSGGNPTDFLNLQFSSSGNTSNFFFVHLLKGHTFDPSKEGAIVSIDGGYDLKNQISNGMPTSVALLLYQNGTYYRGPSHSISATTWSTFNHSGLKATDFVNISNTEAPNPVFSCAGKPIQMGFVALASRGRGVRKAGIDNWSIHLRTTCCSESSVRDMPAALDRVGTNRPPPRPLGAVKSRCCCDDDAAVVDNEGMVILPGNVDMDTPPVFEYVDQEVGDVADLYPGADTTLDTWYQKYPCKTAIGGSVPKEVENPNFDIELEKMGIEGVNAEEIPKQLASWEEMIAKEENLKKLKWSGPAAPNYTPPATHYVPDTEGKEPPKYAFGGRDIIFIHGLKLEHIFNRITGSPVGAMVNWKQPTSFPADTTNPEFYTGYYKHRAELTWMGSNAPSMGGHISEFLLNKGYKNRFLVVSYNNSERLDVAVRAVLAQIGDAMKDGIGVVNPNKPNAPRPKDFGTPSFVIVSHSTGGLVTDVALTVAAQVPSLNATYIPKYCKAHIAVQGAHRGSRYATAAIALSKGLDNNTTSWLLPLVREIGFVFDSNSTTVPNTPYGLETVSQSILVDLVPLVAQQKWGKYVRDTPVRTLTVVGGHPTFLRAFKYLLHPGFDDAVLTINSQVANPNDVLLAPSGFRTDAAGLIKNFDMGVFGLGPNANIVPVRIGAETPVNFTVNIVNTSLNSPTRAIGYYIDQKFDRIFNPGNPFAFPVPSFFAAGATPYISPTGMLQTVTAQYASGTGNHPWSANPLNRNPNIFSFLQSASDHFKGTHDQKGGFNGDLYGNSPFYSFSNNNPNPERNFEETRVITDPAVYTSVQMPYGDNEPLLRPQNIPPVVERIRGLRVTFTLKFFKKKWIRTLWVWKRRYHLLDGWETKRQFDYVYESVLKN